MKKKRIFSKWLSTFRPSINGNGYDYYTDFKTVYENVQRLKIEVNILNTLIGSQNIEHDFVKLMRRFPLCLKVIPLLLMVRKKDFFCQDEDGAVNYQFKDLTQSIEQYKYFMKQTGLFEVLQNHYINNIYNYIIGLAVGLDSNARKDNSEHQMENLVERFLKKAEVQYYKEMNLSEIKKKWDINLAAISANGTADKRWDFVVKTPSCIYCIETNFYTGGGSKLNETARSYKMIAEEAKNIPGFKFVWITDGYGWLDDPRDLKETFKVLETLYNIADMENGIFKTLFS